VTSDPFDALAPGQIAERDYAFTSERVGAFADMVNDHAPVHVDADFAKARGFPGRIVHGFLLSAPFSGLLGEELPGPASVINQTTVKLHHPVAVGETLRFQVSVTQVTPAVRAAVLKLTALGSDGKVMLSGSAVCSFPRITTD
jgi:3-hydroxybutyryl-CoA dehydratase